MNHRESFKKRAQSVEFTYYNEAGEVEEIEGYNDDDLQHASQNGHPAGNKQDTLIYHVNQAGGNTLGSTENINDDFVRPSEIAGHLGDNTGGHSGDNHKHDGGDYVNTGGRRTPDDYLRMSGLSTESDEYVIPDIPRDDDYVKPDPSKGNDDYVNMVNTRDIDLDDEDYLKPSPHGDDGYVGPDPAGLDRSESNDYSYPVLPKGIHISNGNDDYVNRSRLPNRKV